MAHAEGIQRELAFPGYLLSSEVEKAADKKALGQMRADDLSVLRSLYVLGMGPLSLAVVAAKGNIGGDPVVSTGYGGLVKATRIPKATIRRILTRLKGDKWIEEIAEPDMKTRQPTEYRLVDGYRRRVAMAEMDEAGQ